MRYTELYFPRERGILHSYHHHHESLAPTMLESTCHRKLISSLSRKISFFFLFCMENESHQTTVQWGCTENQNNFPLYRGILSSRNGKTKASLLRKISSFFFLFHKEKVSHRMLEGWAALKIRTIFLYHGILLLHKCTLKELWS